MPLTPGVDWDDVRARLDRVDAAIREALEPSPGQVRAVLEDRARALALVPATPPAASELTDLAVFSVSGESYGVETRYVRRVVKLEGCTPVPGAPGSLRGVVNVSGEILPLFDLPAVLGVGRGTPCAGAYLVVLGEGRDELGVSADAVAEVRPVRGGELLDPSGAADRLGRGLVRGLTADAVLVLDGAALLADDRLVVDQGEETTG